MSLSESRLRRLIVFAVAALACGTALAWGLYLIRDVLQLIYLSGMMALGFNPAVRWLHTHKLPSAKQHMPRWAAILIFYSGLLLFVVLVFAVVVPPFVQQGRELIGNLPEYVGKSQRWLVEHGLQRKAFSVQELIERGAPVQGSSVTSLVGAVGRIVNFLLTAFTVMLLAFYFTLEGETIFKTFVRTFDKEHRHYWVKIGNDVGDKVGAWMGGQFLLCLIIGMTASIGFYFIGLPYFYVLALICGVGEMIPIVGPIASAVPAILVAATVSPKTAVITAIYLFLQQQLENSVIVPRLMRASTGISPTIVIVAIMVGGSLLGVLGALLAVPTAAVLQILIREYLDAQDAHE